MGVQSLSGEDPLEEGTAIHCSVLAWRIPWTEEPGGLHTVHGVTESDTAEVTYLVRTCRHHIKQFTWTAL